jgi:hypothetical protein
LLGFSAGWDTSFVSRTLIHLATMAVDEGEPILYVVLEEPNGSSTKSKPQYARPMLQIALTLMGCKTRYAHKITQRVFKLLEVEASGLKHKTSFQLPRPDLDNHTQFKGHRTTLSDNSLEGNSQPNGESRRHVKWSGLLQSSGESNTDGPLLNPDSKKVPLEDKQGAQLARVVHAQSTSQSPVAPPEDELASDARLSVEQLRTPSFHARLRKGKWPANVPGPDENGASERESGHDSTTVSDNPERMGKHTVCRWNSQKLCLIIRVCIASETPQNQGLSGVGCFWARSCAVTSSLRL